MIRVVSVSLESANKNKLALLDSFEEETLRVLQLFIDQLWETREQLRLFSNCKTYTWLSSVMQQNIGNHASSCIKSGRLLNKVWSKPVVSKTAVMLSSQNGAVKFDQNSFDGWLHLRCLGNHIILDLPFRKHKHFNKYQAEGWTLKKSFRLRKTDKGWFLDLFFEKEAPPAIKEDRSIGIDCGYKKLIAVSDGYYCGVDLKDLYEKAARKRSGSKAQKRVIKQIRQESNRAVKQVDLTGVSTVVVEDLKGVKHKSKFSKKFNNKMQYWSYRNVFERLQRVCEETGRTLLHVDPAYSSQTCSLCGHVDRNSRKGEQFWCTRCGMTKDADLNASEVILQRGTYGSPSLQQLPWQSRKLQS